MLTLHYSVDLSASQIVELTRLSRQTINTYLTVIRRRLVEVCNAEVAPFVGYIEVDESYFGARRVKGKRGRGARGKQINRVILKFPK